MKQNMSLSGLACAVLFTAPLLLTGCQAVEGLFTESPDSSYGQNHAPILDHHHKAASSQTTQSTTATGGHSSKVKKVSTIPLAKGQSTTKSAVVPVEPPTVPTLAPTVPVTPPSMSPPTVSQ